MKNKALCFKAKEFKKFAKVTKTKVRLWFYWFIVALKSNR